MESLNLICLREVMQLLYALKSLEVVLLFYFSDGLG